MKRVCGFVLGLALLTVNIPSFANGTGITYWNGDISGTIQSGSGGTEVSLKNDLNLRDQSVTQFDLDLNFLGPKAYFKYYKAENSGYSTSHQAIFYNGQNFAMADPITSQLDQTVIDIGTKKSIVKSGALQVDLLGGLRYMDLDATLKSGVTTASDSVKAVIPTLGVGAQTKIGSGLHAKASISGLDISIDGKKVDTYDLKYGIEYKPVENVAIGAGVQKSKIIAQDDENKGDLRRDGSYFEVVVKF